MALVTLAQYQIILGKGLKFVLSDKPELVEALAESLLNYAQQGADERNAVRALLKWYMVTVLGKPFNGHEVKHMLQRVGVNLTNDLPSVDEPLV